MSTCVYVCERESCSNIEKVGRHTEASADVTRRADSKSLLLPTRNTLMRSWLAVEMWNSDMSDTHTANQIDSYSVHAHINTCSYWHRRATSAHCRSWISLWCRTPISLRVHRDNTVSWCCGTSPDLQCPTVFVRHQHDDVKWSTCSCMQSEVIISCHAMMHTAAATTTTTTTTATITTTTTYNLHHNGLIVHNKFHRLEIHTHCAHVVVVKLPLLRWRQGVCQIEWLTGLTGLTLPHHHHHSIKQQQQ